MRCDICAKKKATVHLTEIVDEQMTEMHLCEDCAKEKSVQMEQQFGLADLLAGLSDFGKQMKDQEKTVLQCKHCGLSYEDFKKFGRLGCSECYKEFRENLTTLLKKIHGSNHHLGKSPAHVPASHKEDRDALMQLRMMLEQAIRQEDFEKAAEIRDKIREFSKKENDTQ